MHTLSLVNLIQGLQTKQFSSVDLVTHFLKRISQASALNAFISLDEEQAIQAAKQADKRLHQGGAPSLTGIPMAHKDNFCTQSMRTTCASKMLANFQAPYDATVVARLAEQGAITLGKTNMDEFAMGSTNETSYFGPVKNPWNLNHVPGGSSGGSAAAVAARLVPFATGSDTGGSIRQPAAFTGISGIKPTYGLISRFGLVAYASSLDQAGILAYSAADIAILLQALAGFDEKDSTSSQQPIPNYSADIDKPIKSLRIGLPSYLSHAELEPAVRQAMVDAIEVYRTAGAEIVEVNLTLEAAWIPCYQVLAYAEASSNLSRYDGIRFGHRTQHADSIRDLITHSRSEGFGHEVKRRILTGTQMLSSEKFDDYYIQAQKIRRLITNEFRDVLKKVDFILTPTTPTHAFKLSHQHHSNEQLELADRFTIPVNLAGLPALSIPMGLTQGFPLGMQLIGNHFSEAHLLQVAHYYQQQTDWHLAMPSDLGENA